MPVETPSRMRPITSSGNESDMAMISEPARKHARADIVSAFDEKRRERNATNGMTTPRHSGKMVVSSWPDVTLMPISRINDGSAVFMMFCVRPPNVAANTMSANER